MYAQGPQNSNSCSSNTAEVHDIPRRSVKGNSTEKLFLWLLRWSCRVPLLYISLLERRSLMYRIRSAHKLAIYRRGFGFGPAAEEDGHGGYQSCRRTEQRIQDTQRIFQKEFGVREPTLIDLKLFLSAWDCGEEWERRNRDTNNKR
jgi:hypothetical protein